MDILITGGCGLLGTELTAAARAEGHHVTAPDRDGLDVTDPERVRQVIARLRPEVVFHCAAYTAVDRAESEPDLAFAVNEGGAAAVAREAAEVGALLVYPSTDYVFDGRGHRSSPAGPPSPYPPGAPTAPLGVYGRSKRAGEEAVAAAGGRWLVARTSWLYGAAGRNFVTTILGLAAQGRHLRVVEDQLGRPTWARNLAAGLLELAELGATGTWHVADGGTATWYGLAHAALELKGIPPRLEPASTEEYGAEAPRPLYSVLDIEATERRLGREMMHWRDALARFLEEWDGP